MTENELTEEVIGAAKVELRRNVHRFYWVALFVGRSTLERLSPRESVVALPMNGVPWMSLLCFESH